MRLQMGCFLHTVAAFSCLKNRLEKHLAEPCNRADKQRMFWHLRRLL
jgi:Uri superfamily endonuclease